MKIKEIKINKIVFIFGILFFISIFMLISILKLIYDNNIIIEKLNAYNEEITILEENKKLSEKWKDYESIIIQKRELIQQEKNALELLEKAKFDLEDQIQTNREKLVGKK